jgi:N-acetylmuramoyl-L-alanine amidase
VSFRRLISALAAAALAALVWAVAPALSTERYVPAAKDFNQPVPDSVQLRKPAARAAAVADDHAGYGLDGPVLYRSEPIEAPRRFDLVGIAGQMHAFEFRARDDGGEWSAWAETDNGDPVYTGGSDQVQIRSRNAPIEGHLHYVNVRGDTTFAGGLLNGLRGAVNSAVISLDPVSPASADSPKPDFITRREWGAKQKKGGCDPRAKAQMGKIKAGVIHHTVSTNDYSEAEAPGIVLGICRYHRNGNGWNDIGYNALVDRFGNVYQGRAGGMSRPVIGAHAEGVNAQTTGVAAIGDYTHEKPTKAARRGIINYLAWKFDIAGISARGSTHLKSSGGETQRTPKGKRVKVKPIFNHGTTNYTDCAGKQMNKLVPKIRRAVQRRLDKYQPTPPAD